MCFSPCPVFNFAPLTINEINTGRSDKNLAWQAAQDALCPAGKYLNSALQCVACPKGTVSYAGAVACTPCPGPGECSLCPPGSYGAALTCTPCPANMYGTAFGAVDTSACLPCPIGQNSPPGSTQCYSIVNSSVSGSSCRDIKVAYGASAMSGWYLIVVSTRPLMVFCDMTTDDGAAYTIFPCNNCPSVNMIDSVQPNGCTALGLKMIIPRTQAHWSSMFNFVTTVLGTSVSNFFQTVPGVYKPIDGVTPCNGGGGGIMNSANCSG